MEKIGFRSHPGNFEPLRGKPNYGTKRRQATLFLHNAVGQNRYITFLFLCAYIYIHIFGGCYTLIIWRYVDTVCGPPNRIDEATSGDLLPAADVAVRALRWTEGRSHHTLTSIYTYIIVYRIYISISTSISTSQIYCNNLQ